MGFLWDLLQQSQIGAQRRASSSLEARVKQLEENLHQTRTLLHRLIEILEQRFGTDIDGDGTVGR